LQRYDEFGALSAALLGTRGTGDITHCRVRYADLDRPARPIEHIAVVAPPALIAALAAESGKHGIVVEDGNAIVPPTRQYKDAEIRLLLTTRGIDGVLVVSVTGDTGVQQHYVGTIFNGNYSATSSGNAVLTGNVISATSTSSGTMSATAIPMHRYSRTVGFQARLSEPKSGRNLWVGGGQTRAGGALFMGDATSAHDAASAILNDLHEKGLIGASGA
jgi:hypothetical protein